MKLDMRLTEKREASPMGQTEYTLVFTSAIPVARLEVQVEDARGRFLAWGRWTQPHAGGADRPQNAEKPAHLGGGGGLEK